MKILLFNLGTIEDRIIDWGIEGFKSLFEHDIILWGPISDKKFVFDNKEIPIISFFEPTTIDFVFNRLPREWYPDIVTCDTSVLNYIPDMYLCPAKTILFTRDSWSDTIFNKSLVEFFDFISHATIDRSMYCDFNVIMLPLSNYAVSIPPAGVVNSEFETREIDVIAIANYNNSFYHERYRTLYGLSALNASGLNIKFFKGIKRTEIYKYYQRSKIVIDWAHTLSNRSYEAALNGCLLFSHKDNLLIKDFWIPWEEYIPYDENNVSELLYFYVNNPDHSKKIISKALNKILRTPESWGKYVWENINIAYNTDVSVQERMDRNLATPISLIHNRTATPLLYNYDYSTNFPSNWEELYFKRIDDALSTLEDIYSRICPLIEAARFAFLLKKDELSLKYLNELEDVLPDYAWIYYLRARIYYHKKENNQTLLSLQKAIEHGLKSPELLQQFVLPVIEKGNTCDGRRITNYMWQSVYNHNNEYQVKALIHLAFELLGDIYYVIGDKKKAIDAYLESINSIPIPDCIYKANPLLIERVEYRTTLEITSKGLETSPYDSILILYEAYALNQLKQKCKVYKVLREHKKALKSFIGIRKLLILRKSISTILLFVLLSKSLSSKIIIVIIRILKRKAELINLG